MRAVLVTTDPAWEVVEQVLGLMASADEQAGPQNRLVRMVIPAGLADAVEQLAQVQRQRKAALDAEDLEAAAALRDREDQLRAGQLRLEQQWAAGVDVQAVVAENQRVHRELDRMRGLLREYGIEPDDGTAQTAACDVFAGNGVFAPIRRAKITTNRRCCRRCRSG